MSRRENRKRYIGDGPGTRLPERKVKLYCTGHNSHERWNLGSVLILDEGTNCQIKFRPKAGGSYEHIWTRADRAAFGSEIPDNWQLPDGRPIGGRVNFRCGRCSQSLPLRSPLWHKLADPLTRAQITELDVSLVDIRGIV